MPRSERPDMAGYGVTDDSEGLLPWSWAEERLVNSRTYWFVSVNAGGRPHAMPVWGVWMPERERWGMSCATSARKVRNIRDNDQVVVTTDDPASCVSLEGRALRIDGDDLEAMAAVWSDKYHDGTWPKDEMISFVRESASFEVIPERAFGLIETPDQFSKSATRWVWPDL